MARLEGRQWGLVALVAVAPFFFAFLLAASSPGLVEPVLGTALGGASWMLAALLGLLGGALFAVGLGRMAPAHGAAPSPVRRVLGLLVAAGVPVAVCIVPAICLLIAGPALAVRMEQTEVLPQRTRFSSPQEMVQQLRQRLPRTVPSVPTWTNQW